MDKKAIHIFIVFMITAILPLCSCSQEKKMTTIDPKGEMLAIENFLLIDGTGAQPAKDKVKDGTSWRKGYCRCRH